MGYTLYELAPAPGTDNRFSPYTWRTKADLAFVESENIRKDLAEATGNENVTVPTLQTDDGFVTDSWEIAQYLDSTKPGILFPGESKRLAHFLHMWADTEFALVVRHLFRPLVILHMDERSTDYFLVAKNGPVKDAPKFLVESIAKLDDEASLEKLAADARAKLGIFEKLLSDGEGPFVLGAVPSHCDAALFGWFASTQINAKDVNRLVWKHPSLPNISRWVDAIVEKTGFVSPFTPVSPEKKKQVLDALKKMY